MMNDFFKIIELRQTDNEILAEIELNPNHHIYDGHFPNKPIVPGVGMIFIMKQILEQALDTAVFLEQMSSCKFLKMLDPNTHSCLQFRISLGDRIDRRMKIVVAGHCMGEGFIKIKGQIQLIE